jgi:uncharacterized protein
MRNLFSAFLAFGMSPTPSLASSPPSDCWYRNSPKSDEQAFSDCSQDATNGNISAMYSVGFMYQYGYGVERDLTRAENIYTVVFELADRVLAAEAAIQLGILYRYDLVHPSGARESFRWFERGARLGNAYSQAAIGWDYRFGEVVPQNFVLAYMWFNIAAANGGLFAASGRSGVSREMSLEQINEAQQRSTLCMRSDYTEC